MLGATIALLWQPLDGQQSAGPDGCQGGGQCYVTPTMDEPDVCEANWDLSPGREMGIDICVGCLVSGGAPLRYDPYPAEGGAVALRQDRMSG